MTFSPLHDAFHTPAAKASVFDGNFVDDIMMALAVGTEVGHGTRRHLRRILHDFSKMLGFFYGDIVGLESASGLRSDQP